MLVHNWRYFVACLFYEIPQGRKANFQAALYIYYYLFFIFYFFIIVSRNCTPPCSENGHPTVQNLHTIYSRRKKKKPVQSLDQTGLLSCMSERRIVDESLDVSYHDTSFSFSFSFFIIVLLFLSFL